MDRERDTVFYKQRCRELKQQLVVAKEAGTKLAEELKRKMETLIKFHERKFGFEERIELLQAELAVAKTENEELRALCGRESGVLYEALKRKNNKSMIKVVAGTLADQAEQEGGKL